jgi:DNA primase large subunit
LEKLLYQLYVLILYLKSKVREALSIPTDLVNRYPWLPSLKRLYSDIADKPPSEFISDIFSKSNSKQISERILIIFESAFNNLEAIPNLKDEKLSIQVYVLLKILVYTLDNKLITNRIANLYSKDAYSKMERDNSESALYDICTDLELRVNFFDPPIRYGNKMLKDNREKQVTNFIIYYIDYLKLASNLRDEYRKLAHNPLQNGYVYIQNRSLMRLIQEYVRNKILIEETEDKASLKAFLDITFKIQEFKELYEKINSIWTKRKEDFDFTFKFDITSKTDLLKLYPPCVLEILKKANEGQNLVHHERLFIVWFLLALEYPVEKVVDVFSTLPDFDREKTTYQVEYAKKKKYTPYQCSTLQSISLCMKEKYKNTLCLEGYGSKELTERKKLKHPLAYIRIKQYRDEKEEEYLKNKAKREREESQKQNG